MNNIELLAPAGDMEAFKVAVMNGANAVYLGMQKFNARTKAGNFTEENIKEVTDFAHLFGVKVYLTINTLIKNSEMPDFIQMVKCAVKAKVDAYLVQDFGVAYVLREAFPNINLHASTQMGIHNLRGAKMAERLGFTRVVLSREAKLEDIIEIKQNTKLEIEYFVQGALCVAFSGNCYFSAFETSYSGNRGMCKQLCRMKYSNNLDENGKQEFLLSPADLCLIKNLQKLIDAGVTSFKIEGRLRREGYVGQAVDSYRKALDAINNKSKININDEIYKLRKVFSRGEFNYDAYLNGGVPDRIINKATQNHLGIEIGKVISVIPFKDLSKVIIKSSQPLHAGDGLKFVNANNEQVVSLGVGNVEVLGKDEFVIYTKHKLQVNFRVFLILDFEAEKQKIDVVKKISINISVKANINGALSCTLSCGEISVNTVTDYICPVAQNKPTTKDEISLQFSKLGDTNFYCEKIDVTSDMVFIPKSIINDLRRRAVENLRTQIINTNASNITAFCDENKVKQILKTNFETQDKALYENIILVDENVDFSLLNQLKDNTLICLSPSNFSLEIVSKFIKDTKNFQYVGLNLPIVANYLDLSILDNIIKQFPQLVLIANNLYAVSYALTGSKVIAGTGLNIFNNFAKLLLKDFNITQNVLSIEQKLSNFTLSKNDFVYTLGTPSLMTFCHCPYKTIIGNNCSSCGFKNNLYYVDQKNKCFAIRRYKISQCYFELLNSSLINNLGWHNYNKFIDLRTLKNNDIASFILANQKNTFRECEILGKINTLVN